MNPELKKNLQETIAGIPGAYDKFKLRQIELNGGCTEQEFVIYLSQQDSLINADPELLIDLGLIISHGWWILLQLNTEHLGLTPSPTDPTTPPLTFDANKLVASLKTAGTTNVGALCAILQILRCLKDINKYCNFPLNYQQDLQFVHGNLLLIKDSVTAENASLENALKIPYIDFYYGLYCSRPQETSKLDLQRANDAFKKSKIAAANYYLGVHYEEGKGCAIDLSMAFQYFKLAHLQKLALGSFNYGWFLINVCNRENKSKYGFSKMHLDDMYKLAFEAYQQSAYRGYSEGAYYLGSCFETNKGTKKCRATATMHYRAAAAQNYFKALMHLGKLYELGYGVEFNLTMSWHFYDTAKCHLEDKKTAAGALLLLMKNSHFQQIPEDIVEATDLSLDFEDEDTVADEDEDNGEDEDIAENDDQFEDAEDASEEILKNVEIKKTNVNSDLECILTALKWFDDLEYQDDMISQYDIVIKDHPDFITAYLLKAKLLLKKGDDISLNAAMKTLVLAGDCMSHKNQYEPEDDWFEVLDLLKHKKQKIIEFYKIIITINPDLNYEYLINLAEVYFDSKQYLEAIKTYTKYLEYDPYDPDIYEKRAEANENHGRRSDAAKDRNKAKTLRKDSAKIMSASAQTKKSDPSKKPNPVKSLLPLSTIKNGEHPKLLPQANTKTPPLADSAQEKQSDLSPVHSTENTEVKESEEVKFNRSLNIFVTELMGYINSFCGQLFIVEKLYEDNYQSSLVGATPDIQIFEAKEINQPQLSVDKQPENPVLPTLIPPMAKGLSLKLRAFDLITKLVLSYLPKSVTINHLSEYESSSLNDTIIRLVSFHLAGSFGSGSIAITSNSINIYAIPVFNHKTTALNLPAASSLFDQILKALPDIQGCLIEKECHHLLGRLSKLQSTCNRMEETYTKNLPILKQRLATIEPKLVEKVKQYLDIKSKKPISIHANNIQSKLSDAKKLTQELENELAIKTSTLLEGESRLDGLSKKLLTTREFINQYVEKLQRKLESLKRFNELLKGLYINESFDKLNHDIKEFKRHEQKMRSAQTQQMLAQQKIAEETNEIEDDTEETEDTKNSNDNAVTEQAGEDTAAVESQKNDSLMPLVSTVTVSDEPATLIPPTFTDVSPSREELIPPLPTVGSIISEIISAHNAAVKLNIHSRENLAAISVPENVNGQNMILQQLPTHSDDALAVTTTALPTPVPKQVNLNPRAKAFIPNDIKNAATLALPQNNISRPTTPQPMPYLNGQLSPGMHANNYHKKPVHIYAPSAVRPIPRLTFFNGVHAMRTLPPTPVLPLLPPAAEVISSNHAETCIKEDVSLRDVNRLNHGTANGTHVNHLAKPVEDTASAVINCVFRYLFEDEDDNEIKYQLQAMGEQDDDVTENLQSPHPATPPRNGF